MTNQSNVADVIHELLMNHLEVVTDLHEERDALKAELAEIRELALCTVDGLNHQVPQAQQCEHEWCKAVRQLRTKLSKES